MKKFYLISISLLAVFGIFVLAQEELAGITFPISELGGCKSKADCETYCDKPENMEACLDFAEKNNLIPKEEIKMARKMLRLGATAGPGGCRGQAECEAHCDDISHIKECIDFAEKYGLIPEDELEEGKKVARAIEQGIEPPKCKNKADCDVYCSQPENTEECLIFAEAAGLIPEEELEEAKMALEAIRKGVKPPPCRGKAECDEYCLVPEHLEECITFAEAAGFISSEEATMVRKTGGKGPGGCRGEEACEAYCEDPANAEECIKFALEYGFMSPEEAEQAKKMLAAGFTTGPGGCKGEEECEVYCNDMSHMAECVDFAEKAGFISPEDAARARKMVEIGLSTPGGCKSEEECRAYCEDPAYAQECLDFGVKMGEISPEEAEEAREGLEMMQRGGPGGCESEEECMAYCEEPSHGEECLNFAIEQGIISPEEAQQMREMMETGPSEMPSQIPEEMPELPSDFESEIFE